MSDTDLSSELRAELFSVSLVVTLTAAVLAVAAAFVTETWATNTTVVFGSILGVATGVSSLYRAWDIRSSVSAAFIWTLVASTIAYGFYVIVFVLATRLGASVDVGAFLAIGLTVSLGIVFSLYRTRIA
jgi:hypothetical protein